jgi:hypothetical protein
MVAGEDTQKYGRIVCPYKSALTDGWSGYSRILGKQQNMNGG